MNPKAALLDVDIQPAFMTGGGLPVEDAEAIIPVVKALHEIFPKERRYATCDRHPVGHISFASSYVAMAPFEVIPSNHEKWATINQVPSDAKFTRDECDDYLSRAGSQTLWPDHAVEGTHEASLHPDLPEDQYAYVQVKGEDPACDSYSGFKDNLGRPTGLGDRLRADGIDEFYITGLAMDYCVAWTAEDALKEGFKVVLVMDATRPVGDRSGEGVITALRRLEAYPEFKYRVMTGPTGPGGYPTIKP